MDTMTFTKIAGGLCGAWLVLLLGSWAAEEIYHVGGGHGDHAQQGYVIEVTGGDTEAEAKDEGPSIMEVLASADIEKGAKVFKKCAACHKLEAGVNGTGPYLFGVVDRDVASAEGFGYSGALEGVEGDWTVEALDGFLTKPKDWAPGTSMGFAGLKKIQDRANVIAYLDSLDD